MTIFFKKIASFETFSIPEADAMSTAQRPQLG
jgi:hypothetical protein